MKKFIVAAIAALGMISATVSFADVTSAPAKKQSVMSTRLTPNQMKMHIVDVTVNNRSDNTIIVRNPPYVNDLIESGANDRLYADSYGNIFVQITNTYNNALIMNQYVCNRAVITVKGSFNNLIAYLDQSQCF